MYGAQCPVGNPHVKSRTMNLSVIAWQYTDSQTHKQTPSLFNIVFIFSTAIINILNEML